MDTDVQQLVLVKEEAPEEQSAGVDQKDPEHIHMKEEQEENWTSLEGEQLHLEEKTDAARFPFTLASIKSEDDEEKPLFSQLHQQQVEDKEVPTSSSAHQMTAETGGRAETSRNQVLNPHEQTSDSSETEMSGDDEEGDDVNLDSELSDSGSETGEEDSDWNESKSSYSHIRTVNKSFSCPECGKQFVHKRSLQKHVRVSGHSAIRSSSCLVKKKCVRVKQHVDSCKKVQKELKSFSCDVCGKRFSAMCDFNVHMRVHTGEKPFVCELCGRIFSRKGNLNRHMRVYTGEKPFVCVLCGKRFAYKIALDYHMRIHTGVKPFICGLCGKRFSQSSSLYSHMRVHTGRKPLLCGLCGKTFALKQALERHMRVHTGEKPSCL
ncbi:oocyte zinc finger protein XlCOF20 [Nothobranchius furzeri]|uniref:oocyte zinc finger protein XlCOF20 n=1 Tax=Nothobranchius furzeri TaxID=105023 RepID=UPI003904A414